MIDERKGNLACGRESKQMVKDNPPSPSAPLKCQGCMIRSAQFVCAGCGNQWYCSRTCQVCVFSSDICILCNSHSLFYHYINLYQ